MPAWTPPQLKLMYTLKHPFTYWLKTDSFLIHEMVKDSQDKDQFLKVVIKRMREAQAFEDELKDLGELNSVLYAQNQELEAKLVEESQAKDGKVLLPSRLNDLLTSE
jgi:hypothetical protein